VSPAPELSFGITLAVLGAGLLHAGWNALLKGGTGGDPLFDTAGVVAASCVWALLMLPFVPVPAGPAWWFIAGSSVIHFGYYVTLAQAYRAGDLSFAYPLMRGTAPLVVTLLGIFLLGERPTAHVALGIVLICAGIVSIAFVRRERHPPGAARWAFANATLIACYTLVDGAGARASGNAFGCVAWLLFLEGWPFLAWIYLRNGDRAVRYVRHSWRRHLLGGLFSLAAYGIVLWAMTLAPVAAVAALRETSVLFAALFGSVWLKEGFGLMRIAGAASVVAGIAALKL
jgi:drug/metabolite transporter (DMT)-like permease